MRLVHSILYRQCTRRIGFQAIVTVFEFTLTQNYTHVFGFLRRICTRSYAKFEEKNVRRTDNLSQNRRFREQMSVRQPVLHGVLWLGQREFHVVFILILGRAP